MLSVIVARAPTTNLRTDWIIIYRTLYVNGNPRIFQKNLEVIIIEYIQINNIPLRGQPPRQELLLRLVPRLARLHCRSHLRFDRLIAASALMIWDGIKRLQDAVSGLYDQADGVVSRLGSHPLSPLVMFLGILTTDGALVT